MEENKVFEVQNLEFSYGGKNIFSSLNLSISKGKITTIMGANGCGKSTLFNLLTKNLNSKSGEIRLEGKNISKIPLKDFAKEVAIVHQHNTAVEDINVEELVAYGRLPYESFIKTNDMRECDEQKVKEALDITGLWELCHEKVSALSGGQRQRVWIAMALAQDTEILFLDEPTTYLDIRYQLEILKLVKVLNETRKTTIVMVLHDINQALAYSDEIIALGENGKVLGTGLPEEVITEEVLKEMYGVELPVTEVAGKPFAICV